MKRLFITGDCHGGFYGVAKFCETHKTTKDDVLIVLGDAGINYYVKHRKNHEFLRYKDQPRSIRLKETLNTLPLTLFCIQGNHEARPEGIDGYITKTWNGGEVYLQENYPNILFAKDGETYDFNGMKTLVLGGAYSVDKFYRLSVGWAYFPEEQMSKEAMDKVREKVKEDTCYDLVLSHTCPHIYEPVEAYLDYVDQSNIDKTTEKFLDEIEENIQYKRWFCGHWHIEKDVDKIEFLFNSIIELTIDKINRPLSCLAVFDRGALE